MALEATPLVSCIMPTANRQKFVPAAVTAFLEQDYEPRELIILDDGAQAVGDVIPRDPRIRYVRSEPRRSLGMKRNDACRLARGEIVVHWDDDDWHARWRLSYQVGALLRAGANVCGLDRVWLYDAERHLAWQYRYPGDHPRWLAGGTLCYRKQTWARSPFEDVSSGEDTLFVRRVGTRNLLSLERDDFYVARVHAGNTSPRPVEDARCRRIASAVLERLVDTIVSGESRGPQPTSTPPAAAAPSASALPPRVSCIMPTANRRAFVRIALDLFREQSYPNRELVVVDDGADSVEDLCRGLPDVLYVRVARQSIGARRNLACRQASGDIIVHWDDDDWYAPDRLQRQVAPILSGRADVTGLENRYIFLSKDATFWTTSAELHARMFVGDVHGGTLAYSRRYFEDGARYPDVNLAEDAVLLRQLLARGARLERVPNEGSFVYVRHGRNAWTFDTGRYLDPGAWRRSTRPDGMCEEVAQRYRTAATGQRVAHGPFLPDCLQSTALPRASKRTIAGRCVALVASQACSGLLDAALRSLAANGNVADAARVVFTVGPAPDCQRVAQRHGAQCIETRALRRPCPASKAALYSMAHVVEADQYLCLDVDVLVLGDVSELFERHASLGPGRVSIGRELSRERQPCLGDALRSIYQIGAGDQLLPLEQRDELLAYPQVINDGVFVADRAALLAIDAELRDSPRIAAWVHSRHDVWWRQKAALNIALARLGSAVPMADVYNVQLHAAQLDPTPEGDGTLATFRGEPARILHFNGSSRREHAAWVRRVLDVAPAPQLLGMPSAGRPASLQCLASSQDS